MAKTISVECVLLLRLIVINSGKAPATTENLRLYIYLMMKNNNVSMSFTHF